MEIPMSLSYSPKIALGYFDVFVILRNQMQRQEKATFLGKVGAG